MTIQTQIPDVPVGLTPGHDQFLRAVKERLEVLIGLLPNQAVADRAALMSDLTTHAALHPTIDSAHIMMSGDQTITTASFTKITNLDTVVHDDANFFDLDNARFNPPRGTYYFEGIAAFSDIPGDTNAWVALYKNGTAEVVFRDRVGGGAATNHSYIRVSAILELNGTDFVDLRCYHNKGTDATLISEQTRFMMIRLR